MNAFYSTIRADRILYWSFFTTFVCLVVTALCIGIFFTHLPPYIPLFNHLPWGEQRLGQKIQILLPLAVTASVFCLNAFLSQRFYSRMPLVSRMLSAASLLIAALTLMFVIRTIQIIL